MFYVLPFYFFTYFFFSFYYYISSFDFAKCCLFIRFHIIWMDPENLNFIFHLSELKIIRLLIGISSFAYDCREMVKSNVVKLETEKPLKIFAVKLETHRTKTNLHNIHMLIYSFSIILDNFCWTVLLPKLISMKISGQKYMKLQVQIKFCFRFN